MGIFGKRLIRQEAGRGNLRRTYWKQESAGQPARVEIRKTMLQRFWEKPQTAPSVNTKVWRMVHAGVVGDEEVGEERKKEAGIPAWARQGDSRARRWSSHPTFAFSSTLGKQMKGQGERGWDGEGMVNLVLPSHPSKQMIQGLLKTGR